jgi:hypothetical protein
MIRPEVTLERTYATKFMANHYLSWNISKFNLGLFESVVWTIQTIEVDVNFVNPIYFIALLNLLLRLEAVMLF